MAEGAKLEKAKILLVDDQRDSLQALQVALERPDYEFVLAESGEEALGHLLRHDIAVILLDVSMPGLDGFQTASLIRERKKAHQIPIIFVTGVLADVKAVFRGYTVGAVDYLVKPLDLHALRAKVGVFVALWRQQREIARTSEALRQAEARERRYIEGLYDVTFEEAPIGIGHADREGRFVRLNPRLVEILGRPREDLLSRTLRDIVDPADRAALLDNVGSVAAGNTSRHKGEYRFVRGDGTRLWIALTVSLLRGVNGQTVELALIEDISEEKRLALALEASERRFERLRESGLIGIFHVAGDGTITEANEAFLELTGYREDELRAGALHEQALLAPNGEESERLARRELEETGVCSTHEHEVVRKDGTRAYVLVGGVAAPDGGITGFALDITGAKQAERERARMLSELRESVRVRDDFLYIAAHELRNPMTPLVMQVTNLLELAARSPAKIDPAWLVRQLEPAERATRRLARLIETLLDVSRLTVGTVPLERQETDLAEAVGEVVERMSPEIARAGCSATVRADTGVVGQWDRVRLQEVVGNLLSNAIKYGAGRPVEVEVEGDPRVGRVSVRDYGIGISRQDQSRIFERFARAVPLHHYGGFGLGLWVVRRIVEAHGGKVELWSEPGAGARFTVSVPRDPPVVDAGTVEERPADGAVSG